MRTKTFSWTCHIFQTLELHILARRELDSIDNLILLHLDSVALRVQQRRPGQGHQAGPGRLEDAEGGDELEERVDAAGLGGPTEIMCQYTTSRRDGGAGPDSHFDDAAA